jgi:hypothetical protein
MAIRICFRGIKFFIPFLVAFAFSPVAHATPMTYFVTFSGGPTLPALGFFTYDASTPSFSNFIVSWGGSIFDLTGAANAPLVGGGCPGASSSPATGFALMNQSLCAGVFYRWFGNQDIGSSSFAFFNETLALPAHTGAVIQATGPGSGTPGFPLQSAGDWTLTALPTGPGTPIPEPSTISLLLLGTLFLIGWPTRFRLSRRPVK